MKLPRFSILGLMAAVVVFSVGFAALRSASDLWDSITFSLTLGLLLTSNLFVVHGTGRRRAFWMGFVLFGWSYLVASLVPMVESRLLTTKALVHLASSLMPPQTIELTTNNDSATRASFLLADGSTRPEVVLGIDGTSGKLFASRGGMLEQFRPICHSLLSIAFGVLGAVLSSILAARTDHSRP